MPRALGGFLITCDPAIAEYIKLRHSDKISHIIDERHIFITDEKNLKVIKEGLEALYHQNSYKVTGRENMAEVPRAKGKVMKEISFV
jgi:hypothetical protein